MRKRSRTHIHTEDKPLYHELLIYSIHTGEKPTHSNKCNFEVLVSYICIHLKLSLHDSSFNQTISLF